MLLQDTTEEAVFARTGALTNILRTIAQRLGDFTNRCYISVPVHVRSKKEKEEKKKNNATRRPRSSAEKFLVSFHECIVLVPMSRHHHRFKQRLTNIIHRSSESTTYSVFHYFSLKATIFKATPSPFLAHTHIQKDNVCEFSTDFP